MYQRSNAVPNSMRDNALRNALQYQCSALTFELLDAPRNSRQNRLHAGNRTSSLASCNTPSKAISAGDQASKLVHVSWPVTGRVYPVCAVDPTCLFACLVAVSSNGFKQSGCALR